MKIAFNIDYDPTKPTGIGRYGIELIKAWNKIGQESELWKPRNTKKQPMNFPDFSLKTRYYPFPRRITNYFWPAVTCLTNNINWVHTTNGMILHPSYLIKQVAMVHDLVPLRFGGMKAKSDTEPWKIRLKMVAKHADCITVNSTSTKNDLLNFFPETEGRVFVTPLGIDHFQTHLNPLKKPNKKHILTVGTVEPRKNIDGLIKAYASLNQKNKHLPKLVIAGMNGFKADEYQQLAADLKIANKIEFTGFISDEKLSLLYSEAYCLVHPAHHEGFGFTVPEAFTWGLPVVASNVGGIGEFFKKAAWMVDPSDVESISFGIEQALKKGVTSEQKLERELLRKTLTWRSCAIKTLNAIEKKES